MTSSSRAESLPPGLGTSSGSSGGGIRHPPAGFRQNDTKVRRMGDLSDYFYDGTWKLSSFSNPIDYMDAKIQTPWVKTLDTKPRGGLGPSHPSLWPIEQISPGPPVWPQEKLDNKGTRLRVDNVPRYQGYIPGERALSQYGTIRKGITDTCDELRPYETKDVGLGPLLCPDLPAGKRSLKTTVSESDLKYSKNYGSHPPAGRFVYKDHTVPPQIPRNFRSKPKGGKMLEPI